MQALPNDMQRRFVAILVQTGVSPAKAYAAAGYADDLSQSNPYKLVHDPRVQAALLEEGQKQIRAGGIAGIAIVESIMRDPTADARDRLKAAEMLWSRGGFHQVTEQHVQVSHQSD